MTMHIMNNFLNLTKPNLSTNMKFNYIKINIILKVTYVTIENIKLYQFMKTFTAPIQTKVFKKP